MRMKPDPKTPDGKIAKKAAAQWMTRTAGREKPVDLTDKTNKVGTEYVPYSLRIKMRMLT